MCIVCDSFPRIVFNFLLYFSVLGFRFPCIEVVPFPCIVSVVGIPVPCIVSVEDVPFQYIALL